MKNQWPELATDFQRKVLGVGVTHSDVQKAADKIQKFLFGWYRCEQPPKRLILVGPVGCGKSTLLERSAAWARNNAIDAGAKYWRGRPWPAVESKQWQELCDDLSEDKSFGYLNQMAKESSLLFIDDLGADSDRYKNQHSTDALCYLLSVYQRRGWMFLTTNEMPDKWSERWDIRTEDRLLRDAEICDMREIPSFTRL